MKRKKKKKGFTLVEIMIVVAIIGILIAIAVPGFLRARENSRGRACQENLQKIDGAKEQWALENRLSNGSTVGSSWLSNTDICGPNGYIKREPNCPSGGSYTPNNIGTDPTCSIGTSNSPFTAHVLLN
jgi:prepilin-type N-terminal cleavage/methylation domain-containing protein